MKPIKLKIGIIIEKEGRILLIKEKYLSGTGHKWNCGTGSWEEGDGSILNSPVREAKEELGLDIELQGLVKVAIIDRNDKTKVQLFFAAQPLGDGIALPTAEEQAKFQENIIDYRWFNKEEILETPDDEFVTTTVAQVVKEYIKRPLITPLSSIGYFDQEKTN